MTERLVVVGGDAAGMSAAARARRRRDRDELEIVAFERGDYTSYSACGLPYFVAGLVSRRRRARRASPEEHRGNGIDVRTDHEVVAIDLPARTVTRARPRRRRASGAERTEPFDQLVVATGATPSAPDAPGRRRRGHPRHPDDRRRHRPARRCRRARAEPGGRRRRRLHRARDGRGDACSAVSR